VRTDPIRIVIVDDDPMVRAHLRTILASAAGLEVVHEAWDGAEAVEAAMRYRPDVMLMDLRMPGVDGLTAIERIAALSQPPVLVALTTFDADEYVVRALHAGAAGYLVKSTPPEDLIGLVRVAAAGNTVLSPAAARTVLATMNARQAERVDLLNRVRELTDREKDVLTHLGRGLSNAEIARLLHLTEATVKGYVSRLLAKLQCENRTQAGLLARDLTLHD
jgi:DNA-binding NarL/FixJ family response regulator